MAPPRVKRIKVIIKLKEIGYKISLKLISAKEAKKNKKKNILENTLSDEEKAYAIRCLNKDILKSKKYEMVLRAYVYGYGRSTNEEALHNFLLAEVKKAGYRVTVKNKEYYISWKE